MAAPELPPVRRIEIARPWRWLALGWQDMRAAPLASLAHGIVAAIGGLVILWLGSQAWRLLPGALSGFVLVAPILATCSRIFAAARSVVTPPCEAASA